MIVTATVKSTIATMIVARAITTSAAATNTTNIVATTIDRPGRRVRRRLPVTVKRVLSTEPFCGREHGA